MPHDDAAIPSRTFLFIRHGETDWNREGRFQSFTDIPLNEVGIAQANAAAERLVGRGITALVSSPLVRALKTAGVIAERLERPVHVDSSLAERSFGQFEGLVVRDVKRSLGVLPTERLDQKGLLPPDAERWAQTMERAGRVVAKWLRRLPGEVVLFVAHTGIFEALCQQLSGTRFEGRHATPYIVTPSGEGWRVAEL